jgi:hypothetical protein
MMKEVNVQDTTELRKMLKECGIYCIRIDIKVSEMRLCN